jgi:hypothetical protein
MSPSTHREHPWAEVPALQRVRDELEQAAARDARAPRRRRAPRRARIGLALAGLLAVASAGIALVAGSGDEAVAGLRDAPAALLEAGRYAYTTTGTTRIGDREETYAQSGEVDLRAGAYRFRTPGRAGRTHEVVATPEAFFLRTRVPREPAPPWRRSRWPGGAPGLESTAAPVSLASVRALKDAGKETVVAEDEDVGGIATTRYRLPMSAADFAGLRGQDAAALADVRGTLDVWLDADDLPRRLRARFASGDTAFTIDTRYARFGRTEPVRAPVATVPGNDAPIGRDPVVGSMLVVFGR